MDIRNEILNIVKKEPKATAEIIEKLKETTENGFIQEKESKFYQTYLKGLEEKGILFKIFATKENKKMLKDIFHRKVWKREKKKPGDFPKEFKTYYIYAEHPKSRILRESIDEFVKFVGDYFENKKELLKETDKLIRLLSELIFLCDKKLKSLNLKKVDKWRSKNAVIIRGYRGGKENKKEEPEKYILKSYTDDRLEDDLIKAILDYLSLDDYFPYKSTINPKRVEEIKIEIDNSVSELINYIDEGNLAVKIFLKIFEGKQKEKNLNQIKTTQKL